MKTIPFITLFVIGILAFSCDPCKEREEGRLHLTEAQKQLIPYTKGSVIRFVDKEKINDFNVTEREQQWNLRYLLPESHCSDYFMFENESTTLKSVTDSFEISLRLSKTYGYQKYVLIWDSLCSLDLYIHPPYTDRPKDLDFRFFFDEKGKLVTEGDTSLPGTVTLFHESIRMNDKIYYDVIEQSKNIRSVPEQPDRPEEQVRLFYNKAYGILQVTVAGKNLLTINH